MAGETVFLVPALSTPEAGQALLPDALLGYETVRLFVDRAATVAPGFTLNGDNALTVAQICHRLDGMPLAIELAAARVKMLSPEQIAARLNDRFRLLTGGSRTALPRQQTLQATIEWSNNLLTEPERVLLGRLSVFAGGWTLEAAETVCEQADCRAEDSPEPESLDVLDQLTQLVNKSLVVVEQTQRSAARFRMLETIRQYAHENLLERGDGCDIRGRHLAYYLDLAERAEPELIGSAQVSWLNGLEAELDNLRAALEWALERDVEAGVRLTTSLARFWDEHDHSREGTDWLTRLLQRPEAPTQDRTWAKALAVQAGLWVTQGDLVCARAAAESSLAYFRRRDAAAEAASPAGEVDQVDKAGEAQGLMILAEVCFCQGAVAVARPLLDQSVALYRALGDKVGLAAALWVLYEDQRDSTATRALLEESLALSREAGHVFGIAASLQNLAYHCYWEGDFATPPVLLAEAQVLQRQLGKKSYLVWTLQCYGHLAFRQGDYEGARAYFQESRALSEAAGQREYWSSALLASVAVRQGQWALASTQFGDCMRSFYEAKTVGGVVYCVEGFARLWRWRRVSLSALCGCWAGPNPYARPMAISGLGWNSRIWTAPWRRFDRRWARRPWLRQLRRGGP